MLHTCNTFIAEAPILRSRTGMHTHTHTLMTACSYNIRWGGGGDMGKGRERLCSRHCDSHTSHRARAARATRHTQPVLSVKKAIACETCIAKGAVGRNIQRLLAPNRQYSAARHRHKLVARHKSRVQVSRGGQGHGCVAGRRGWLPQKGHSRRPGQHHDVQDHLVAGIARFVLRGLAKVTTTAHVRTQQQQHTPAHSTTQPAQHIMLQ